MMNSQHKKIYVLLAISMITWAIAWTNAYIINDIKYNISSNNLVFLRFAICVLVLCPFVINKKFLSILKPINLIYIVITGILFFIYNIFFFKGTAIVAGEGAILVTTINPIITVSIMSIINKKISWKEIAGITMGVVGGVIIMDIFNSGFSVITINDKYIFFIICAISWGIITVLTSFAQKKMDPFLFIFFCYLVVTIISFPFSNISSITWSNFDSIFYINFFLVSMGAMAFGTSIYVFSTTIIGPVKASVFIFSVPLLQLEWLLIFLMKLSQLI